MACLRGEMGGDEVVFGLGRQTGGNKRCRPGDEAVNDYR
jgi:hypothetical protein